MSSPRSLGPWVSAAFDPKSRLSKELLTGPALGPTVCPGFPAGDRAIQAWPPGRTLCEGPIPEKDTLHRYSPEVHHSLGMGSAPGTWPALPVPILPHPESLPSCASPKILRIQV